MALTFSAYYLIRPRPALVERMLQLGPEFDGYFSPEIWRASWSQGGQTSSQEQSQRIKRLFMQWTATSVSDPSLSGKLRLVGIVPDETAFDECFELVEADDLIEASDIEARLAGVARPSRSRPVPG